MQTQKGHFIANRIEAIRGQGGFRLSRCRGHLGCQTLGSPIQLDCTVNFTTRTLTMDKQAVIAQLNEILKHEWTGVAQYSQASFIIEGTWREVYSAKFEEDAAESFNHAKLIGNKIVSLGGVPVATRNEIKQTRDLTEMLQNALAFESKAVEMYTKALELAEGTRPLVIFLEDILLQEQEGVDEYSKLLRETTAAQAELGARKSG
jgi:bacterioferritin